ncbi:MAG: phosphatase PAP2 family protein [Dehalococcoidia bacterium]|nr:phosphatase PAP2 family protein [Dehalococcoidia bacterium]
MISADVRIFHWLNGLVGRSSLFDNVVNLLASDFFLPVMITMAAFALWFVGKTPQARALNQRAFLYAAIGAGFANLLVRIVNGHLYRARPFIAMPDTEVLFYRPHDPSFPSNAAAFAFAITAGVFLVNRRWGMVIAAGAVLFTVARVIAGMHYPLDIVSGALLGILTTWVFAKALDVADPLLQRMLAVVRWFHLA